MVLNFYLRYGTKPGQKIFIISDDLKGRRKTTSDWIPMHYINADFWGVSIILPDHSSRTIHYYYLIEEGDAEIKTWDGEKIRTIEFPKKRTFGSVTVIDTWNEMGDFRNAFFTKAFLNLFRSEKKPLHEPINQSFTHLFRAKVSRLKDDETLCLLGSTTHLHKWDTDHPVLMTREGDFYFARISLGENEWPASYKYGIYNTREKKFVAFEEGQNRLLRKWESGNGITVLHDGFANINNVLWKGAGINIPVFSLRSEKSFGAGEFMDLKLLITWCEQTGISMIQLLPVNDTSARGNRGDSYPYSAISAFALHPLYINLEKVAGRAHAAITAKLKERQKRLNNLPQMDYEQVIKYKRSVLKELYALQKDDLKRDRKFLKFFKDNKHWLVPYAAFCYLKGKYKTADFTKWKAYSTYDESAVQKMVSEKEKHYGQIAIYYYEQYHLHLQLKEVVDFAHKHNVIMKGDLPIGIYRHSCDAWIHPALYNMAEQAGAPPDQFSTAGQNWGFPTYNWDEIQKNHFMWWRQRFDQLGKYFDAFRIDHILGFFRIWSIPIEQTDGRMGRFVPAIAVHISEFEKDNIYFDYDRYCKPYITDKILEDLFGANAEKVIHQFLLPFKEGRYKLREEVSTQRKALKYLMDSGMSEFREGLFKLVGNVIFFEDSDSEGRRFHFRINIQETSSFQAFDTYTQNQLKWLYNNYFFERQEHFWEVQALKKLPQLKHSTDMLVCGEDLGMVPRCVPDVMRRLGILGLNVQRMSDESDARFLNLDKVNYLSIVQPSTHDMSTIRGWWEENREQTQQFYNKILRQTGEAPQECDVETVRLIIQKNVQSDAMWSIFLPQDLLAMSDALRTPNPADERINIPSDPDHYWGYRMNVNLEHLLKQDQLNKEIRTLLQQSGRFH